MTPEDAARALIQRYVERGDSYESLIAGRMGASRREWSAAISGGTPQCPGKFGYITVDRVNGEPSCHRFSLRKLYDQIRAGVKQTRLL